MRRRARRCATPGHPPRAPSRAAAGAGPCTWFALSFATRFGCFADPSVEPYPYIVYVSDRQTGNGTVHSGERAFTIGTPLGLEVRWVCLYVLRDVPGGEAIPYLVAKRQLTIDPRLR